jgi:tetratricopeptide (TPR) repeat protein
LAFVLGGILVVYCTAGILFETRFANNVQAESVFCRFFLCDNALVVWTAREHLWAPTEQGPHSAIEGFRRALQRDTHDPHRWADLGEAFLEAGQIDRAGYCYSQVLARAPHRPAFLLRVSNFHFQLGETTKALPITAQILGVIPEYDSVIFSQYTRLVDHVEEVLQYGLPEDRRAAQSYLRYLVHAGRLADAQRTWDWVAARHFADDTLAGDYVRFLIRQHHPDVAAATWAQHLGTRAGDYLKSDYLFNGDFEFEPAAGPFDWRIVPAEGVEVVRDSNAPCSGQWSLRISFPGTTNLAYGGVSQMAFVKPGPCRFQACVRSEGITTDQGIRFRIFDVDAPARLNVSTREFSGTTAWTRVEQKLLIPPETKLLQVQVVRQPSNKFDNKISGIIWVDAVRLVHPEN